MFYMSKEIILNINPEKKKKTQFPTKTWYTNNLLESIGQGVT